MLSKQYRLKTGHKSILRLGKKRKTKYFIFFYKENYLQISRFSVITSKKLGNAVQRNAIRRRTHEVIREGMEYIKKGYDIVIIPSLYVEDWNSVPYAALKDQLIHNLTTLD
jgi:ribonuclease P protein component